ncbi:MAG TPA: PAS domain S-box protein, partial [Lacunisphaera sp.]|nr:PAS domain S-box protein [Lacunisphaera sp.]
MQPVIIMMVVMLYAAFGCMFLFMNRQHPSRFARLMAQSWLIEMVRAYINYTQFGVATSGMNHWHSLSDCMAILATWWLFSGCADLAGVKLPARLGWLYVGISLPVIMGIRYFGWRVGVALFELSPERAAHLSVSLELVVIFVPVTIFRAIIVYWLLRVWHATRLPGAMLATVFGVPFMAVALFTPVQYLIGYYADWIFMLWAARVLGFSLGLVMLLFDRQLAAQRERERAYRTIVETSHDLIWSVDRESRWSSVNQAVRRIYGIEPEKMLGRRFTDFVAPERIAADREAFAHIVAGDAVFNYETVHLRPDGSRVNLSFNAVVLRNEAGVVLGVTGTAQDITERKKAEERVRQLASFPELNPNPVLEFNAAGALAYQNPAAQTMVRKAGEGRLEQLLPAETKAIVLQCLASGQPRLRIITTHGKLTLSWSFYPIVSQQVVHCYIGDITERTQLEEQLRQAQKMEAVGQLAGGVAHDFNNLLTAIIGHVGLLQGGPALPPEGAESLEEISRAANRAANLTNQLLTFSRLHVINIRPLDLNEVVTHLGKMLRRVLGEHVAMQLDFSPEQLVFNGDAGMIEQVVINLAVNARDAMPTGGTLRLSTGSATGTRPGAEPATPSALVWLSVSDTGSGISAEVLPKIFEPFFTTKEVGKGTGLGLATAFGIVQQHHGWIEVDSELGRGSTFRVYLPRLTVAPDATKTAETVKSQPGRGEVILLVEDEASVRDLGGKALRGQGYRVLVATNGQTALDIWATHRDEIVLLLTDVIMPGGISGLQLARQLQAEKPTLRVVYTSGYSREIAGTELATEDGVNYLAKPYELEKLFHTVRDALDGRHSGQPFPLPGAD